MTEQPLTPRQVVDALVEMHSTFGQYSRGDRDPVLVPTTGGQLRAWAAALRFVQVRADIDRLTAERDAALTDAATMREALELVIGAVIAGGNTPELALNDPEWTEYYLEHRPPFWWAIDDKAMQAARNVLRTKPAAVPEAPGYPGPETAPEDGPSP